MCNMIQVACEKNDGGCFNRERRPCFTKHYALRGNVFD